MKKMHLLYFKTMIFFLLIPIQGCITLSNKETVIERSEKGQPEWIQENWQGANDKNFVYLIFKKIDIYNLNLGLKQAQSAAILQTSHLIMNKIQKTLLNKLPSSSNISNKKRDSIFYELSQVVTRNRFVVSSQPALPKDVYWEYRQKDTDNGPERFYIVWVLLTVPKIDYESALKATARSLTKSEHSDIVDLGQNILQQMNPH